MATFNSRYIVYDEDQKELSDVENDICTYIAQNDFDDYDLLISDDDRWKIFYHLSGMRKSLLNWYVFKKDSSLLEVGGSFGALTGLFCDRCREVVSVERFLHRAEQIYERHKARSNLTVYAGRTEHIQFTDKLII